jgi:hypothetical protein
MMKRSFVLGAVLTSIQAGSVVAADMPTKAYQAPPVEVFSARHESDPRHISAAMVQSRNARVFL